MAKRVLLHKDHTPVKIGEMVKSFRGEEYKVLGWATDGRNRVYVMAKDASHNDEFFPSVFDMVWEDQL